MAAANENPDPAPDSNRKPKPKPAPTARTRPPGRASAGLAAGLMGQANAAAGRRRQRPGKPEPAPQADGAAPQEAIGSPQGEIDFTAPAEGRSGYDRYQQERQQWLADESERLGLPLGKRVEVDIGLGRTATGLLQLDESSLLLDPDNRKPRLRVGRLVFEIHEIQSCLRVDD